MISGWPSGRSDWNIESMPTFKTEHLCGRQHQLFSRCSHFASPSIPETQRTLLKIMENLQVSCILWLPFTLCCHETSNSPITISVISPVRLHSSSEPKQSPNQPREKLWVCQGEFTIFQVTLRSAVFTDLPEEIRAKRAVVGAYILAPKFKEAH